LRLLAVQSASTVTSVSTLSNPKENVSIYPNPSIGSFTLKAEEPLGEIRIMNQLGQTVLKTNINEKIITLFLGENDYQQIYCGSLN